MMRWLVVLALLVAGCASRAPTFVLPDGRAVDDTLTPAAAQNITVTELTRGEQSSVSAVQIRDREQPHVHTRYDLTVVLERGRGTLWLNGRPIAMREGDAVFIPKNTPHYFVNDGSDPAAAVVVFSPPFSGPDQAAAP
jgi:quercetin dioxygenase-like cupin family protein